ncbi:MAG: hypothetical protein WDA16_14415 [Candidatus Thermoplasmatota archaeon]
MLRLLLMVVALLAAPISYLGLSEPASPRSEPVSVNTTAPGGTPLVLDASAMPGSTGWFLIPVTSDKAGHVEMETKVKSTSNAAIPAFALLVAFPDEPARVQGGGSGWASRPAEVNANGTRIVCCDQLPVSGSSGSGGGTSHTSGFLAPGQTLWVGIAGVHWDDGSKLRITITPQTGVTLAAGKAHAGTNVALVDLVDLAQGAGRNVRFGGQTLIGSAGEGSLSWDAKGTSLIHLMASAQGDSSARLSVTLPNGTPLNGVWLHDGYVGLSAFKEGPIKMTLTELYQRAQFVTTAGNEPTYIGATALLADIDVPLDGFMMQAGSFESNW